MSLSATIPLAGVFFSILPVYARDELSLGAGGLGLMVAVYGVGALTGSIVMTVYGNLSRMGRVYVWSAVVYESGMVGFAFASSFDAAIAAVFVLGLASTFWKNTTNAVVQTSVPDEMRGRVMSVFGIGMQMLALGWLVGGASSTQVGNPTTLVIAAAVMLALNVFVYTRSCEMRRSN